MASTFLPISPSLAILALPPLRNSELENDFINRKCHAKPSFIEKANTLTARSAEHRIFSNINSEKILNTIRQNQDWKFRCVTASLPTPNGITLIHKWAAVKGPSARYSELKEETSSTVSLQTEMGSND